MVGPQVVPVGQYELVNNINQELTVYKAISCDVLDTYANITISIKKPDGSYAKAKDGTILNKVANKEYAVELNEFGAYSIEYRATDTDGNVGTFTRSISVYDLTPPELVISDDVPKTASVGSKIKSPEATATDNETEKVTVKIFVYSPANVAQKYVSGMKYEAKGMYVIRYFAVDAEGNISVETFKVKVS
jgi:hypothetical protein